MYKILQLKLCYKKSSSKEEVNLYEKELCEKDKAGNVFCLIRSII